MVTELERELKQRYFNRELSWLDFNERVLSIAEDPSTPLLERVKFLAIFASGLDEFYMVRVAGLKRQVEAGLVSPSADGLTPREQLALIAEKVVPSVERHARVFSEVVRPALAEAGVEVLRWAELDDGQRKQLNDFFTEQIFPVLTPLAVDPGHPFPYISNLSLNLAVLVRDSVDGLVHFARVKVPPLLPRFIPLSERTTFVPLEDVIAANLDQLFNGMDVVEHRAFRVTRNSDLEVNDDGAEDLLQALEEVLRRSRFSPAVRLEIEADAPELMLDLLTKELEIDSDDVHTVPGPLDLAGLWALYDIERPDLKERPFKPATPPFSRPDESGEDVFSAIASGDILVHHPYDSFAATVEEFIEQAARDPQVLAIKQTLYRTSEASPIANALIEAAQAGKQVVVLVEIKARGDERANIQWARTLERAGCHIVYGLVGLKTHSKLCLVVRQEGSRVRRYVHVGTGNYNPRTARTYEDFGLLTADPALGGEASHLFNLLTGYSRRSRFKWFMVAPHGLRERIVSLIEREAGLVNGMPGHISFKVNSLIDEAVIDALYSASQAGVKVDLLVRGICSLRPGVPGVSENIRVRSIVGRYLEHSRIFYFANGGREEVYMGSADLMHRNLDRRVETVVAVREPKLRKQLVDVLALGMEDNSSAWDLDGDGSWSRLVAAEGEPRVNLQEELMRRAVERARG